VKSLFKATDETSRRAARQLLAYGLWIRVVFIAAMAVVGGLAAIFDGGAGTGKPLSVALIGAALAVYAWHRAGAALEPLEQPSGGAPAAARAAAARAPVPAPAGAQA